MSSISIKRIEAEPDPDRIIRPREVVTSYEVTVTMVVRADNYWQAVMDVQKRLEDE